MTDDATRDLRDAVVDAALPHIVFDGWTAAALMRGAEDAGLGNAAAVRAFPDGPTQAIAHWSGLADRRMLAALEAMNLGTLKIRERIATAVRVRLEQVAHEREAVRRALSVLALPINAPLATRLLYRTVDAMWHAAGDTATDFNFYTKRALLAGVYGSTVLTWLDDTSEDHAATWAFLDRRIEDTMRVTRLIGRLREAPERFKGGFGGMKGFAARR